jgi:hypothetical protein
MEPEHAPVSTTRAHTHDINVSGRVRRILTIISAVLGLAVVIGMLVIGFGTDVEPSVEGLFAGSVYEAEVVDVERGPCAGTTSADAITCNLVEVRLTQGPDEGDNVTLSFSVDSPATPDLGSGDRIVLNYLPDAEPESRYQFADRQRRIPLLALASVFALASCSSDGCAVSRRWRASSSVSS